MTDPIVKVKPLVWDDQNLTEWGATRANTEFGFNIIVESYGDDNVRVSRARPGYTDAFLQEQFSSWDEAKAAAQAEYDRLILGAIEAPTVDQIRAQAFEDATQELLDQERACLEWFRRTRQHANVYEQFPIVAQRIRHLARAVND